MGFHFASLEKLMVVQFLLFGDCRMSLNNLQERWVWSKRTSGCGLKGQVGVVL